MAVLLLYKLSKRKLILIQNPIINKHGVSIYSIWIFKIIMFMSIVWFALVLCLLTIAITFYIYGDSTTTWRYDFVTYISYFMTFLYQLRSLSGSIMDYCIIFEWISLYIMILREKNKEMSELLYQAS